MGSLRPEPDDGQLASSISLYTTNWSDDEVEQALGRVEAAVEAGVAAASGVAVTRCRRK